MRKILLTATTTVTIAFVLGCGSGDPLNRQAVSGTVTYKGQPVIYGTLDLAPLDNQPTVGNTEIKDGRFEIPAKTGLAPGKYAWRVYYPDPVPKFQEGAAPGSDTTVYKNRVPKDYAEGTKNVVEIKAGQKNELKLDIP
jgi:hypothetical protein